MNLEVWELVATVFFVKISEGFNDGHHFHSVVCSVGIVSADCGVFAVFCDDRCPSARAWIAKAASVCVDFYGIILHVTNLPYAPLR